MKSFTRKVKEGVRGIVVASVAAEIGVLEGDVEPFADNHP